MAEYQELDEFKNSIEGWTEELLRPYLDGLSTRPDKSCRLPKEFNDAVWTTVVLGPLEVIVLDSPLLQRLRHIRQLGVVHLVYPSATHSRLEHSIGTLHQIVRLIEGINAKTELISKEWISLLRITALAHDVGHGVMSHVSENALLNFHSTRRLLKQFSKTIKREHRRPSELAAYYMIGSPAFEELISQGQRISGDHTLPPKPTELMQQAIVGRPINPEVPLLQELISGPFDADKLDYMTRDARMTGVPVVTDIPRLVQKVRGHRLPTDKLPSDLQRSVPKTQQTCVVTGIALSGGRTLDELVFGQTLLFDKLYRHQKVRAAEAMVAAILDQIATLSDSGAFLAPFALLDADILNLDRADIERVVGHALEGAEEERRAEVAIDIAGRLHTRKLFRRAYAFAQSMPQDPYRADEGHRNGLVHLTAATRRPAARESIVDELAEMVNAILEVLGSKAASNAIPGGDIRPYIWIDPPKTKTQSNETVRAYLLGDDPDGPPAMPFRDEYAETPGWSNAYLLTRDTGYVFTIDEFALPVYLATEKYVRMKFGVRSPDSMLPYAKQHADVVAVAKRKLAEAGFYDDAPYDIRPSPPQFDMADFPGRLIKVRAALEHYEGPVYEAQEQKRSTIMSPQRIGAFVQQFGVAHADEALSMLAGLHLVGRDQLVEAVNAFVTAHPDQYMNVVPLGEAKDSSSVTTYYAGDIADLTIRSLGDALRRGDGILFAEDFVGSGAQTISLFESLLDAPPSTALNEEREEALPEDLRELFVRRKLAIVYAAGSRAGVEAVEGAAARLQLDLDVYLHSELAPTANLVTGSEFEARCRNIGEQLLADDDPAHDATWISDRALGYGNQGFLIVFPYNTPTQTLTCLWKEGIVDGVEWVPLVPRRPKR
jgi:deoxynucleoside triphosphate triphosphohydrolase SAMHD1